MEYVDSLTNKFDQLKGIVWKYVDSLTNRFDHLKEIVWKYVDSLTNKFVQLNVIVWKCVDSLTNKFDQLKEIVWKYVDSLTNKFDQLKGIVLKYVDILMITKIKLDDTFPERNRKGTEAIIYIRKDIPRKLLTKHVPSSKIEGIFVELNFRKSRWILNASPTFTKYKIIIIFL